MIEPFDVNKYIQEHINLLPINGSLMPSEAEQRASKLLVAVAVLASYRLNLSNLLAKSISSRDISYTQSLVSANCTNVFGCSKTFEQKIYWN